jgi:hypothetical protein
VSDLVAFASRLLEREGALVEVQDGAVEALLPEGLGERLGLPAHALLAQDERAGAQRLAYGSELLEKLLSLATPRLVAASARLCGVAARPDAARAAAQGFVLRNGLCTASAVHPHEGLRLCVHAACVLHGDERREGLVSACVSPGRGLVAGFEADLPALEPSAIAPLSLPLATRAAGQALAACAMKAQALAGPFRESMQRRHQRDRERLEGYFADLSAELARRATGGRVDPAAAEASRQALAKDRAAKLEALAARSILRIEVRAIAALLVSSPAFLVGMELRRRKGAREIELEFDCATRRLVAPPCEACGGPAPRPAVCDDALHLLCEVCAPRPQGRIACGACRNPRT